MKEAERQKTTNEIENFKKSQIETPRDSTEFKKKAIAKNEDKDIFKLEEFNKALAQIETKSSEKELPMPRSSGNIQVKFTPRVFPTPSRESQETQEKEVRL